MNNRHSLKKIHYFFDKTQSKKQLKTNNSNTSCYLDELVAFVEKRIRGKH